MRNLSVLLGLDPGACSTKKITSQHGKVITGIMKYDMTLLIHSQTSVKFGNGSVISSHTLLGMWLLIHAGLKIIYATKRDPVAYLLKKVNPSLGKPLLKFSGSLGKLQWTSSLKWATGACVNVKIPCYMHRKPIVSLGMFWNNLIFTMGFTI